MSGDDRNDSLQAVIRPLFVKFVKPGVVLVHFRCFLTDVEFEKITNKAKNHSNIGGAHLLFDIIIKRKDWFPKLLCILRSNDLKLQHIAYMMTQEKQFLERIPAGENGYTSNTDGPPLSALYIKYNKKMENAIEKFFLEFIDPHSILHVFHNCNENVLTRIDIQNVRAEMNNHGTLAGAQKLLERLILYENWFDVLMQVLKDIEITGQKAVSEMESATANIRKYYKEESTRIDKFYAAHVNETHICSDSVDSKEVKDESNNENNVTEGTTEEYESDSTAGAKFEDMTGNNTVTTRASGEYDSLDFSKIMKDHKYDGVTEEHLYESFNIPKGNEQPLTQRDSLKENNKTKISELIAAVTAGNADQLVTLIESSDINETDDKERTVLMHAALTNQLECVQLLMAFGCEVNKRDCNGNTALMIATGKNHIECVKILASEADVDVANYRGSTALMVAASKGYVECMKLLIEKDCDVSKVHNDGLTALIYAACYGHPECVQLLLDRGCDINKSTKAGQTALMFAAKNGHTECVNLLIGAGSDVNNCDYKGQTALIFAADKGHRNILEILINKGADIDKMGENGNTALMCAICSNHIESVKFLVRQNARLDVVNNFRVTPSIMARQKGYSLKKMR